MSRNSASILPAALTAAMSILSACSPSKSADPRTAPELVTVAEAQSASVGERAFSGVISARVQSNLGFRISGKVIERLVDSGQTVHQGQPLMRLDRTDYTHAITSQLGNADAARARLQQAAADEERYRGLVSSGAVSQSAYDQVKASADSARAMLSAAEAQLKIAEDVGAYSTLVADADGVVMETLAEPGQFVSAGQIVVRVAHAGAREAAVNLPEDLRPVLGSAAQAILYGTNAASASRYGARLRQLSEAADPATRTFEARYVLDGVAAKAPLGATVTVYLRDSEPSDEISVPLGAIDDEGRGPGVWLLDRKSSSVAYRSVTFIRFAGEQAVVRGKVHIGDPIIAVGGHFLHEGQRVQLAQARQPGE